MVLGKAMEQPIFLDNNSTTPVDPQVLEAMLPYFHENPGNAASQHKPGQYAEDAVEDARESVANIINASAHELIFTSGATESLNIAIQGILRNGKCGNHIITSSTEHPAVLDCCKALENGGAELSILRVDNNGEIDLDELKQSIKENTCMIAIMYANNETGVINPVDAIAEIASANQIPYICDATQAIGKIPVDVESGGIDIMAFSAHKIYGPKGTGALFISSKYEKEISPSYYGGEQERGLSPGTQNVPAIVGFGEACRIARRNLREDSDRIAELRHKLEFKLLTSCECEINGADSNRLPNTCNILFKNIESQLLLESVHGQLALSTGSACSSGNSTPSHVLQAMGKSSQQIMESVRFSLGKYTTSKDIDFAIKLILERVEAFGLITFEESRNL